MNKNRSIAGRALKKFSYLDSRKICTEHLEIHTYVMELKVACEQRNRTSKGFTTYMLSMYILKWFQNEVLMFSIKFIYQQTHR